MRFYLKKLLILTFFIIFFITGCFESQEINVSVKPKITVGVSIVPQKTFVESVAGDLVDIITLIPPGYSPANYAPSPRDLQKLSEASLYFSIGVPAETNNILPKLKYYNKNLKIIDLAAVVAKVYPEREFAPGKRDPHIWLSPKRVKVMVDAIASELSVIDPDNSRVYIKNAQLFKEKLDKLDNKLKKGFSNLDKRKFIVFHPAFGYFADDYNLEMIAVEKDGKKATIQSIQRIIDVAKENDIKVIFFQAEMDGSQIQRIAHEIGAKVEMIEPLSSKYIINLEKIMNTFIKSSN